MLFALICRLFESIVFLSPTEAFLDWYFAQAINKSADVCVLPCLLILDLCFLAMQRTVSVMTLCNWVFMHWQAYLICILKICACCSCCGVQSNVDVVKGFRVSCGETKTPGASSSEQILFPCKQMSFEYSLLLFPCYLCMMYLLLHSKETLCHECSCYDRCLDFGLVQTCILIPVCCAPGSELAWSALVMPQGIPAASKQVWWEPVAVWVPLPAGLSSAVWFFQGSQTQCLQSSCTPVGISWLKASKDIAL